MRKNITTLTILLVLLPTLFSCGNSYNRNLRIMSSTFKKQLEDSIFKNNATLKIYESNAIGYDTIDDSFFMKEIRALVIERISSEKSDLAEFSEVASPFGESMDRSEINTIKGYKRNIRALNAILDSIGGGKYKKSGEPFYLYKEYLKATIIYSNGKKENIMDTIRVAFNKNLEEINSLAKCPPEITQLYKRAISIDYTKK